MWKSAGTIKLSFCIRVKESSMTRNNDIITPEGYFDSLQQRLQAIPGKQQAAQRPSAVRRLMPYVAYAASLALLVAVGNFILRKSAAPAVETTEWSYYSYLAQSLDPDCGLMEMQELTALSEDDIVRYLVEEGVSLDFINEANYEEGY